MSLEERKSGVPDGAVWVSGEWLKGLIEDIQDEMPYAGSGLRQDGSAISLDPSAAGLRAKMVVENPETGEMTVETVDVFGYKQGES